MASAARVGALVDAELAPAKCVAWSPGAPAAPPDLTAQWRAEGVEQFSIPLGTPDSVAARVAAMAADNAAGVAAVVALQEEELQTKLLLLRLCAGPQVTFALRALPPDAGAPLAAAVDADVQRTVLSLLCDANDGEDVRAVLLARAALSVRMGGVGLGDRSHVAAAAVVASWADAARFCHPAAAPALAALAGALADADPAGSGALAGAQADSRAWPGAPARGGAAGAAAAGSPRVAGASPLGRSPSILSGLLAAVATLNTAGAAAPAPPPPSPTSLSPLPTPILRRLAYSASRGGLG
eukprot:TRINITY_DN603_c0_g1_i2.p2 TRINITY_DN603_c0_g1~~TRINITY_DN603_c0_g1_i2.p2  ORF type:complete len:297 (-),score=47.21 TRINITY_DN603_c0_g1_i2:1003-1893(-)